MYMHDKGQDKRVKIAYPRNWSTQNSPLCIHVYDMLYMCMNFHLPTTIKGMDARAPIRTIIMSHSTEKHPRQTASSTQVHNITKTNIKTIE